MNLRFAAWPNFWPGIYLWAFVVSFVSLPIWFGDSSILWTLLGILGVLIIAECWYSKQWDDNEQTTWPARLETTAPASPDPNAETQRNERSESMRQSPIAFVGGLIAVFAGTFFTIVAAVYLFNVHWVARAVDYGITAGGQPIPPETYAFLLLAFWSAAQRIKVHLRPDHWVFLWEDRVTSWIFAGFIALTILKVLGISNPNPTYLPLLGGFLIAALVDVLFNGRHRYEGSDRIIDEAGDGADTGDGTDRGRPRRQPHPIQVTFPGITDRAGLEALFAANNGGPIVVVNMPPD